MLIAAAAASVHGVLLLAAATAAAPVHGMLLLSFMVIKLALLQLLQCCASILPVQGHGPTGPLAMLACHVITPASLLLLLLLSPQLCHNTGDTWKKHSWWRCLRPMLHCMISMPLLPRCCDGCNPSDSC
jgi:hypothetical protein